ncbi:MAG TPA: hypothetical protein ENN76_03425 [Euryarchaeota archaeon]|nr:hypothetical protein [Euryarchaeota archaeon]
MSLFESAIFMLPPVALGLMLLIGYLIYLFGGKLAFKGTPSEGKLTSYACGEDIPGMKLKQKYSMFHVAFFFTMLHVAVLLFATLPKLPGELENAYFLGLVYLMGVSFVIVTLLAGGADNA